jgi:hypothetical protein
MCFLTIAAVGMLIYATIDNEGCDVQTCCEDDALVLCHQGCANSTAISYQGCGGYSDLADRTYVCEYHKEGKIYRYNSFSSKHWDVENGEVLQVILLIVLGVFVIITAIILVRTYKAGVRVWLDRRLARTRTRPIRLIQVALD